MSIFAPKVLDPKADMEAASPEIDKSIATIAQALKDAVSLEGLEITITIKRAKA